MLLAPAAWLYGCAIALRNRRFDRHAAASHAAPVPVISVGNLTVGGVGKTPMVIELVHRLIALGRRPAVLTRGYGARPGRAADEVLELRSALPDTPVVVDADRVRGAAAAALQGADVVVLDDGFQHRRLRRDLDLVLVDALNPWGGGRLLPAGRLREPLASLRRAHAVIITRANQAHADALAVIERDVRRHAPDAYVCHASVAPVGLTILNPSDRLAPSSSAPLRPASTAAPPPSTAGSAPGTPPKTSGPPMLVARAHPAPPPGESTTFAVGARVLPVCGIGNPASFVALLRALAPHTSEPGCIFRDHHDYTAADVAMIRATAERRGADLVVTTRKDWVKLAPLWPAMRREPARSDTAGPNSAQRRTAAPGSAATRSAGAANDASGPRLARLDVATVLHEATPHLDRLLWAALARRAC